jgi:hypothetical protein
MSEEEFPCLLNGESASPFYGRADQYIHETLKRYVNALFVSKDYRTMLQGLR